MLKHFFLSVLAALRGEITWGDVPGYTRYQGAVATGAIVEPPSE